jgi:hypothetical protein
MRSTMSVADRDLVARLEASEGRTVSAATLERWRARGLLKRPVVQRGGVRGSRVPEHDEEIYETCAFLAHHSRRGQPWEVTGGLLFEAGGWLRDDALRTVAAYVLRHSKSKFEEAWRHAETGATIDPQTPGGWLEAVAKEAARQADPSLLQVVEPDIALVHPGLTSAQRSDLARVALAWRIADIVAPQELSERERNLARHGVDGPINLSEHPILIPSELGACVETLTYAEADLAREMNATGRDTDREPNLLDICRTVATLRMQQHFEHPERPLSNNALNAEWSLLMDEMVSRSQEMAERNGT